MILRHSIPLPALLFLLGTALAQDNQPPLTALEKEFQESMSGVTLTGRFTRQGGDALAEDKYTIEKATRLKDDLWQFSARVKFGGQEITVPVSIHVRWAGDTPVLTLTDESVAGMGKYSVRIVVYKGQYSGIWSNSQGRGGQMFGSVVKITQ